MNLDITKYLKNKDITLSNDDLDLDRMSKDLYEGYTKNSDIKEPDYSGYVAKADFDKLQNDYTTLENNYNTTVKALSDTNDNMARVSLESKLVRKGFKEEDFGFKLYFKGEKATIYCQKNTTKIFCSNPKLMQKYLDLL